MKKTFKNTLAAVLAGAVICTAPASLLNSFAAVNAVWPTQPEFTIITTPFDPMRNVNNVSGYHNAIDIQADYGTNIYAACPGTVNYAGWLDGYGYIVILYHADLGVYTFYAHASSLLVSRGESVSQGQVIAKIGSTGVSSGNHLHFGVSSSLDGTGYPSVTFYDPLTYFTYTENVPAASVPVTSNTGSDTYTEGAPSCGCSEDYAGEYTTKGVTTYLNIRSGHGSSYAAVGKVPANAQVKVTKADGSWAHVEYNGVSGFCSMDYLQKISDVDSDMTISDVAAPDGLLAVNTSFGIRGNITSALPITKVWGGVYTSDGQPTAQYAEAEPNTRTYDLKSYFDGKILFNRLAEGSYIFRIEAEDTSGQTYELISNEFFVGNASAAPEAEKADTPVQKVITGDLNGDSEVNIADGVMLQNYLLHKAEFTADQYMAADMNENGSVDVFDMIVMKQVVTE